MKITYLNYDFDDPSPLPTLFNTRFKYMIFRPYFHSHLHVSFVLAVVVMNAYRLARFVIMRASFPGVAWSEQRRHLGSCNTKQLGLRLCFLNGIKLKKNITVVTDDARFGCCNGGVNHVWNLSLQLTSTKGYFTENFPSWTADTKEIKDWIINCNKIVPCKFSVFGCCLVRENETGEIRFRGSWS